MYEEGWAWLGDDELVHGDLVYFVAPLHRKAGHTAWYQFLGCNERMDDPEVREYTLVRRQINCIACLGLL